MKLADNIFRFRKEIFTVTISRKSRGNKANNIKLGARGNFS